MALKKTEENFKAINMQDVQHHHTHLGLSSDEFDAEWYVEQYPDVKELGMDPAEHYLWIGRAMRRQGSRNSSGEQEAVLDVLFVDGALGTTSTTYRVDHIARGMSALGHRVRVIRGDELEGYMNENIAARHVTFFRAPLWSPYREFADKMRRQGATIIYDTDDFVFDEEVLPLMDGVRFLSENDVENYRRGIRAYREFILYSDVVTLSTSALVDEVRRMGKEAFRVRNTISKSNMKHFQDIQLDKRHKSSPFVVGYYSGTKTHQADFAVMVNALSEFMDNHQDVVFRLVGQFALEEFPVLNKFSSRIIQVDLMSHDDMLEDQLKCDVIVAPLEIGNSFCEAKSELKFFEAALARCPVIASATRSFKEATHAGRFAKLAANHDEWLNAFETTYANYDEALITARAAFDYVCTDYAEEVAAEEALAAYSRVRPFPRQHIAAPIKSNTADVAVLITDVIIGGGGHRKVFNVCNALEQSGYTVAIYVLYSSRPESLIRDEIRTYFYPLDAEVYHFTGQIENHQFAICTHWTTAYEFRKLSFSGQIFYFVQDFEPMFEAVGSDYMRALATYSMGFKTICYGKWVAARLENEVGIQPDIIPFGLDHELYSPGSSQVQRDIDILFFARPSQDRRCYSLIMEGLKLLKISRPSTRIGLFGENEYPDVDFEHQNYGLISDLNRLSDLYRSTKVGICFSTTNPSQLGYEMIACGATLLDVKVKFCELNFGGDDFVKYCLPTPENIAAACLELIDNEQDINRRREAGINFINSMPPDEKIGYRFIQIAGLGSD
jgi:glycosyltransferase involved in cell wall biosynthesis